MEIYKKIYNFIRGLSPYPAAWSILAGDKDSISAKVYASEINDEHHKLVNGTIISDSKSYLKVAAEGGFVFVKELQIAGKRRLKVEEFLKGFKNIEQYRFC